MKFKAGMITGMILGVAGAAGAGYAMSGKGTRRRLIRNGRRIIEKANNAIENLTI